MQEKKANLPRFDPANKDAPGAFKILDAFETQTLVTMRNNEFTQAFNDGRINELYSFFTKTGGVVGTLRSHTLIRSSLGFLSDMQASVARSSLARPTSWPTFSACATVAPTA
jgi:hypothetical protein